MKIRRWQGHGENRESFDARNTIRSAAIGFGDWEFIIDEAEALFGPCSRRLCRNWAKSKFDTLPRAGSSPCGGKNSDRIDADAQSIPEAETINGACRNFHIAILSTCLVPIFRWVFLNLYQIVRSVKVLCRRWNITSSIDFATKNLENRGTLFGDM